MGGFVSSTGRNLRSAILVLAILLQAAQVWAEDVAGSLKGNLALNFAYEQSDYVSRQLALSSDVSYEMPGHEIGSEFMYNKKNIELPNVGYTLLSEKYDASVKWRHYLDESSYYTYLSPRIRHNQFGYYTDAKAIRVGMGKKIMLGEDSVRLLLEAGTGYRVAHLHTDEQMREVLYTVSGKIDWQLSDSLVMVFNLQHEQSAVEQYRTAKLSLRNKVTRHFGLVYEYTYARAYPFDSLDKTAEQYSTIGLAYEI